jgi:hypothetical protein
MTRTEGSRGSIRIVCAGLLVLIGGGVTARADFLERFDNGFDNAWHGQAGSFPDEFIWANYPISTVHYQGAPAGSFQTVSGAQTYRLTNTLAPLTRVGMVFDSVLTGTTGRIETRINTLTQDTTRIDGFADLWLLNATDPSHYVRVGLFGSDLSADRGWNCGSSVDGAFWKSGFNYVNNTWYRLRIDAGASSLRVSVWNDAGTTELVGQNLTPSLASLGSSFRVGLAQFMSTANGTPHVADVAVDYVSASLVPEPATWMALAAIVGLIRRRSSGTA